MADLATIAELRTYLGRDYAGKDDDLLAQLITRASAYFEAQAGRVFEVTAYTDTVDGNGTTSLVLAKTPVVSITSVLVDGESIPQRPTVDDEGWVLQGDRLRLVGYYFTSGVANVVVDYTAGLAVPNDVKQAVVTLAALAYRERDRLGVMQRSMVGTESTMFQTLSLPVQVDSTIKKYWIPGIA